MAGYTNQDGLPRDGHPSKY